MPQMAQLHRHAHPDTSKSHAPTVEQLLRGEEASKGSPSQTEDDHCHHHKKSVLAKVKEKAKKLRYSLSKKKHDDNAIPSVIEDEENEDTEYLGAPMYESELAPKRYKENARQHPRANGVISEKHVLPAHTPGPSKTMPDYTVAQTSFPSRFQGLFVSESTEHAPTTSQQVSSATASSRAKSGSQTFYDASVTPHASSKGCSDQIWDKGVSMKEFLMSKFEPGEDDRALSQVISEAMSPKRTPDDKGVMEKVRDAVTCLLRKDEPSQYPVRQTSSEIPLSTSAYQVGQEESQGRILQAN